MERVDYGSSYLFTDTEYGHYTIKADPPNSEAAA